MAANGSTYVVERITTIGAPPAAVYAHVVDFHRWTEWSPWEDVDPDLRRTYGGPDAGVGASYAWVGNRKAGQGSMEITAADAPSQLDLDLHFLKPFKAENDLRFRFDPDGDGTRVTWTMTGQKTFMTKVMGVFMNMDKLVGSDFEKGLDRLKAVAEA